MQILTHRHQAGFTLVELMIVIAIIAIIVMLAVPAYQDYSTRAKIGESLSVAAVAKTSVSEACQTNPLVAPTNVSVGYSFLPSNYVQDVIVSGSCTEAKIDIITKNTGAEPPPQLRLTGNFEVGDGRYKWDCYRVVGSSTMVPSRCREITSS